MDYSLEKTGSNSLNGFPIGRPHLTSLIVNVDAVHLSVPNIPNSSPPRSRDARNFTGFASSNRDLTTFQPMQSSPLPNKMDTIIPLETLPSNVNVREDISPNHDPPQKLSKDLSVQTESHDYGHLNTSFDSQTNGFNPEIENGIDIQVRSLINLYFNISFGQIITILPQYYCTD